ncbi:MAG: hypothetical protein IKO65_11980 [Victivallales bacterium]|nr:hypothetical protein [Victivallales bacterium]
MKPSFLPLSHWFSALFVLTFPLFADYIVTVQNGPQSLFQHPVSVELTAEQVAFVQQGATLMAEDSATPLPYVLDTTGQTPRLCFHLDGETAPGALCTYRLACSVPANSCSGQVDGDLECTTDEVGFIIIRNSYFQLRHPMQGAGGFPQDIQYRESGYTDSNLRFFDRLFHPDLGLFWVRYDQHATAQIVLETPERVVVEVRAHFVGDGGLSAPGDPVAIYRYIYSAGSPIVEVERLITRSDASQPWPEAHFLQTCRFDRFYTAIHTNESGQNRETNPVDAEPCGFSFSRWGVYASPLSAFGIGGTAGNGYDRGREGFPYNLAATNLGLVAGEAEKRQTARLYLGPARDDEWYERWLSADAQPRLAITESTPAPVATAEDAFPDGTLVLENHGLKIFLGSAEDGFPCLAVVNALGDTPVRFVTHRDSQPGLWKIAFKKPYPATETIWLTPGSSSTSIAKNDGDSQIIEWQGIGLPGEPGVVDVHCEIIPVPNRPEFTWRIRVTNRSTQWGLTETQFPMLSQVIQPGKGDALLPDSNWGHRLFRNSAVQCDQLYPSHKCQMQFMAFNQGDAGLYFAAHDTGARPKRLVVTSQQDASFRVFAENSAQPEASRGAEFDFCLAAYQGDWWQAAKRYRKWATAEAPWTAKGPIVVRNDFPRSLVDIAFWQQLSNIAFSSCDHLGSLMEQLHARLDHRPGFALHWYCWHQIPFDNSYPEYFPVREGFDANVRRLTSQGMLAMPYINGRLWDVDIPSFADARAAAALPENGSPAIEVYGSGRRLTPMCPYTRLWQDKMDYVCSRLMDEYHVSGIYLDQISCGPAELCFNPEHGHPLGGGTHWVDGYRTLLARIKAKAAPKGVFLTSECGAEPYMDNLDGHLIWTPRTQEDVPTLAAVYSGYTIYFSNTSHPEDDEWPFKAQQARDFLWGCQPGWNAEWIADEAHRKHFAYQEYLGYLQRAAKEFFREGELLAEQRPANAPGTVTYTWHWEFPHQATLQAAQGYWWKAPDGRLMLAIANLSPDVRAFNVADANLASLAGPGSERSQWLAERLTDAGTAPLRETPNLFSHCFTLEPGEVVLVTFTPADAKMRKNAQKRAKTLAFDQKIPPELRNSAAEYLFRTEYGVTAFHPAGTIRDLPGATCDFNYFIYGTPDKKCTVVLPDGQNSSGERGPLHTMPVRFAPDDTRSLLYCELRNGDLAWRLPVQRRPAKPLEITLGEPPEIRAGKSFLLPVGIENFQNIPASGTVRLNLPDGWQVEPSRSIAFDNLQPRTPQHTLLRISVPANAPAAPALLTAEILAGREDRTVAVAPPKSLLTAIRVAPHLDVHDASTWPDGPWAVPTGVKIADYHGNDDCSARVRCAWDDQYLYVQAEVTDDVHLQTHSDEFIWKEDCLQFALRAFPANLAQGYDGREREFGLALPAGTDGIVYQWMGGDGQGLLADAQIHAEREGNLTRYRAAIPWNKLALPPPKPGMLISFAFTVNDNDSDHLRGWLEWASGVCGGKDSSLFGELRFGE